MCAKLLEISLKVFFGNNLYWSVISRMMFVKGKYQHNVDVADDIIRSLKMLRTKISFSYQDSIHTDKSNYIILAKDSKEVIISFYDLYMAVEHIGIRRINLYYNKEDIAKVIAISYVYLSKN